VDPSALAGYDLENVAIRWRRVLVVDIVEVLCQLGMRQTITSFSSIYNPKFIEALGPAAEGVIVTSLAPNAEDSVKVKEYVARWKTEKGREPNGLPYTQYLYDAPYLIAEVFRQLDKAKIAPTGDTFRKAMLDKKSFELPLTDDLVVHLGGHLDVSEAHRPDAPEHEDEHDGDKKNLEHGRVRALTHCIQHCRVLLAKCGTIEKPR